MDQERLVQEEFVKLYFQGEVLNSSLSQICNRIGDKLQIDNCKDIYRNIIADMIQDMVLDMI
jgi:hypothetical protein